MRKTNLIGHHERLASASIIPTPVDKRYSESLKNSPLTRKSINASFFSTEITPKAAHRRSDTVGETVTESNLRQKLNLKDLEILNAKNSELKKEIEANNMWKYIAAKDSTINNLRKEIQTKDQQIAKLQENTNSQDKQKIAKLNQRIEFLEKENKQEIDTRCKMLQELINEGDAKLKELRQQIQTLEENNEKLLNRNHELISQIIKLKCQTNGIKKKSSLSSNELSTIESQFHEIEAYQRSIIGENKKLKKYIDQLKHSHKSENQNQFAFIGKNLNKALQGLTQIKRVVDLARQGAEFSLEALFNEEEKSVHFSVDSIDNLFSMVNQVNQKVSSLRSAISDIYAENCASSCVTQ